MNITAKLVTSAAVVLCLACPMFAEDLSAAKPAKEILVTEVGSEEYEGKKMYFLVINNQMKITELEATKFAGKTIIKYPVYVSQKSGKAFPQVKVITKQANDAIVKAVETGSAVKPEGTPPELDPKITSFNLSPSPKRKANVEVTFSGAVTITCGVMETGAEPWVSLPSRRDEQSGKFIQLVFLKGSLKKKVEDAVLKKYQVSKSEGETGKWK